MVRIPLDQMIWLGLGLGWTTLNSTHTRTSHLHKNSTQLPHTHTHKKKIYRTFTFCQPKIGCPTTDKALQVLRDHNFSFMLEGF